MKYETWFSSVFEVLGCYLSLLPIVLVISVLFGSIGLVLGFVSSKTQHTSEKKK